MSGTRKVCTFRQRDLAAALRAAKQTGHEVSKIFIEPDGRICVEIGATGGTGSAEKPTPLRAGKQVWLDLARKRD